MRRLTFHVEGMGCRGCVRKVTARFRDVPGVETVAADAASSLVHLSGTMRPEDALRSLAGTAYVAVLRADSATTATSSLSGYDRDRPGQQPDRARTADRSTVATAADDG